MYLTANLVIFLYKNHFNSFHHMPRRDLPRFIAMYQAGLLPVDKLRSSTIQLDEINEAFDALATGTAVRQVITFEK